MHIFRWFSLLCLGLGSLNSAAWQIDVQADNDKSSQVVVSNDRDLHGMMVYLVWFDKDNPAAEMFQSWTLEKAWQKGLQPISNNPLDLKPFDAFNLTNSPPTTCPETHRCFMGMVAIPANSDPLNSDNWQAVSMFPLNVAASKERIKGQRFFLASASSSLVYTSTSIDKANNITAAAPTSTTTTGSTAQTEKPDILRLVGTDLWYANAQAQRLQVIDVSKPEQPKLSTAYDLKGTPREIYQLGQYTVLLESLNSQNAGTQLTVLTRSANGKLSPVDTLTLTGNFLQSRRRENVIYSVMSDSETFTKADCIGCSASQVVTKITALSLDAQGKLQILDTAKVGGYTPSIAIFPDYLVLANDNPQPNNWTASQVQVFDLSQASAPLRALPGLLVPGQVPSEFHLNVFNQQLRLVYGAPDRAKGSSLAIYDLRNAQMPLIGKVDNIAIGEQLFATRFTDNRAFVVTYKRTDPLWVIDLNDATAPKIVGELKVPGWSEKLFFNNDRLFALGINDQPLPNEKNQWVRRVAASLFDVRDPANPKELGRFTPFAGEVSSTSSIALDDERALSLDWQQSTAAFPLTSWETQAGNHLQLLSFANDQLQDLGRIDVSTSLLRSLPLQANILAALGDQSLFTVKWGKDKPQILAELELATSVNWLHYQAGQLWGVARGDRGFYRAYRYDPKDLTTPAQRWSLARAFDSTLGDKNLIVFYSNNPAAVQVLDTQQGQLSKLQLLEDVATPSTVTTWYDRSQTLLKDGWLYVGEQHPFVMDKRLPANYNYQIEQQNQWVLRSWNLQATTIVEAPRRTLAGRPLTFTNQGLLVTQEYTEKGQNRVNVLALSGQNVNLVSSRELDASCYPLAIQADGVYVQCTTYPQYNYAMDTAKTASIVAPQQSSTILLKLDAAHNLAEVGRWTWSGYRSVRTINNNVVIISNDSGGIYYTTAVASTMPYGVFSCELYRLDQAVPTLLKSIETCPYADGFATSDQQGWVVQGFAGISTFTW
ncbi:MAG: beta-propeller domain-containing protein [Thiotrichaceae bacterium]|nr:beta-propeller domain-containing protein [Thiotrichaceae bacterium]